MTLTPRTLGQRLHLKRTLHGWTLRELGKRSELGYSYIWALENNHTEPYLSAVEALARALRCKPSWLAGWK